MQTVKVGDIKIGNNNPLVLIGGPCVIESEDLVLKTADKVKKIADKLGFPFIFKSSYLKDNRSSANSNSCSGELTFLVSVDDTPKLMDTGIDCPFLSKGLS
jgi:2-dehydro-3-deoxyphosphooctonate aldolase (KDO 8-P synthase)